MKFTSTVIAPCLQMWYHGDALESICSSALFCRWRKWDSEGLNELIKVDHLIKGEKMGPESGFVRCQDHVLTTSTFWISYILCSFSGVVGLNLFVVVFTPFITSFRTQKYYHYHYYVEKNCPSVEKDTLSIAEISPFKNVDSMEAILQLCRL